MPNTKIIEQRITILINILRRCAGWDRSSSLSKFSSIFILRSSIKGSCNTQQVTKKNNFGSRGIILIFQKTSSHAIVLIHPGSIAADPIVRRSNYWHWSRTCNRDRRTMNIAARSTPRSFVELITARKFTSFDLIYIVNCQYLTPLYRQFVLCISMTLTVSRQKFLPDMLCERGRARV